MSTIDTVDAAKRDYNDEERRQAANMYLFDQRPTFHEQFFDSASFVRTAFNTFVDLNKYKDQLAAIQRAIDKLIRTNVEQNASIEKDQNSVVAESGSDNTTLVSHALHYGAGATVTRAANEAGSVEATETYLVELPWAVSNTDTGYQLRQSQRVVLTPLSEDADSFNVAFDEQHLLGDEYTARLVQSFDPTAPVRRLLDGSIAPRLPQSIDFVVNGKRLVQMRLVGTLDTTTGKFVSFTSPQQVRGTAALTVARLVSFASVWRPLIAAFAATGVTALRARADGQDRLSLAESTRTRLFAAILAFKQLFGANTKAKLAFHAPLLTSREIIAKIGANGKWKAKRDQNPAPIDRFRADNLLTVVDRVEKNRLVYVRSFGPQARDLRQWRDELSNITGVSRVDELSKNASVFNKRLADAKSTLDKGFVIASIATTTIHVYKFPESISEVPDDVQNLYARLRVIFDRAILKATEIVTRDMVDVFSKYTDKIAALRSISAAMTRSTAVEENPEELTAALLFIVSEAFLDQPGGREFSADDSAVVLAMRELRDTASEDDQLTLSTTAKFWRLFIGTSEIQLSAVAVRGAADDKAFAARTRARLTEADELMRREILQLTGVARTYTSQLRNRIWSAAVFVKNQKYESAQLATRIDKAKNEVFGDVDLLRTTLFSANQPAPDGSTSPPPPKTPDVVRDAKASLLLGQINTLLFKLRQADFSAVGIDEALEPAESKSIFLPLISVLVAARKYAAALKDYYTSNGEIVRDLSDDPDIKPTSVILLQQKALEASEALNKQRAEDLVKVLDKVETELPIHEDPGVQVPLEQKWTEFEQQITTNEEIIKKQPQFVGSNTYAQIAGETIERLRRLAQGLVRRYAQDDDDDNGGNYVRALAALRAAGRLYAAEVELRGDDVDADGADTLGATERMLARIVAQAIAANIKIVVSKTGAIEDTLAIESTEYARLLTKIVDTDGGNGQVPIPTAQLFEQYLNMPDNDRRRTFAAALVKYYELQRDYFRSIVRREFTAGRDLVLDEFQLQPEDFDELNLRLQVVATRLGELAALPQKDGGEWNVTRDELRKRALAASDSVKKAGEGAQKKEDARETMGHVRTAIFKQARYFRLVRSVEPFDAELYKTDEFVLSVKIEDLLVDIIRDFANLDIVAPKRELPKFTPQSLAATSRDKIRAALQQ